MPTHIKRVSFKPGLPLEIEVIPIAATLSKHRPSVTAPHRAEFYHIFWFRQGTATHIIDFEPVEVGPNTMLFVNQDRVQMLDERGHYDGRLLLFTANFFAKDAAALQFLQGAILFNDLLARPVLALDQDSPLIPLFQAIEAELAHPPDTFHYDMLRNQLHNLLLTAEREIRKDDLAEIRKGADFDYLLLFKQLVDEHYRSLKSVAGYARQMAVSERRLSQATAAALGKSPKAIIDERVMLEARRLLFHTTLSIKEIAFGLGFEEATNFIKYFRKHEKRTPIEFREHYRS